MKSISVEYVREQVERIKKCALSDPEMAHSIEGDLYVEVLTEIAEGTLTASQMQALAAEACKSGTIDFPRWTA